MLRFLIPFALVWTGLVAWALWNATGWTPEGYRWAIAAKLFGLPVLAAWVASEVAVRLRKPRAMDPRVRDSLRLTVSGLVAGILSAVLAAAVFAALPGAASGEVIVPGVSALTVLVAVWFMPRVRVGSCVHCGYEVQSLARCPECGRVCASRYIPGPA